MRHWLLVSLVGRDSPAAGEMLLEPARQMLATSVTGQGRRPLPPVVGAELGNQAGAVGAAMLARRLAQ